MEIDDIGCSSPMFDIVIQRFPFIITYRNCTNSPDDIGFVAILGSEGLQWLGK